MKTRTYDLSITYDKYYQTPRVWLFGYDEVNFYRFFLRRRNLSCLGDNEKRMLLFVVLAPQPLEACTDLPGHQPGSRQQDGHHRAPPTFECVPGINPPLQGLITAFFLFCNHNIFSSSFCHHNLAQWIFSLSLSSTRT